jgi:hypothetical protein
VILVLFSIVGTAGAASPFDGSSTAVDALPVPAGARVAADDGVGHLLLRVDAVSVLPARWYDLDVASRTTTEVVPPDAACAIEAGGAGGVIADCDRRYSPHYFITALPFSGWRLCQACTGMENQRDVSTSFTLEAVGTHWLQYESYEVHGAGGVGFYSLDGLPPPARRLRRTDINSRRISPAPCRRVAHSAAGRYVLFAYSAPWALLRSGDSGATARLYAQRCTWTHPHRFFTRALGVFAQASLRAGRAVWTDVTAAYVRNLKTGRTRRVELPDAQVALRLVGKAVVAEKYPWADGTHGGIGVVRLPPSF